MRKIIIDTDVCSDDAAAMLLAMLTDDVEVLAVTTVSGGVVLSQATQNALQTIEEAGQNVPVYMGASKGLFKPPFVTTGIHGADGMGACGLIHPTAKAVEGVHASDAILSLVKQYPGEIDLIALAPVTNIGLAILKEPETMKQLKSLTVMGTGGFGPGNTTPVAEANVYSDAESYDLMLSLGVPTDILGFDLCIGDSAFNEEEMLYLENCGNPIAHYVARASSHLAAFNRDVRGAYSADICDAVAMACYLWPEIVLEKKPCCARVCKDGDFYGQVVFYTADNRGTMETLNIPFDFEKGKCNVFTKIDTAAFKQKFVQTLTK